MRRRGRSSLANDNVRPHAKPYTEAAELRAEKVFEKAARGDFDELLGPELALKGKRWRRPAK